MVHQCDALSQAGVQIVLYAKRSIRDMSMLKDEIQRAYGVDASRWQIVSFFSAYSIGTSLLIAFLAMYNLFFAPMADVVHSRNLYAAWLLAATRRRVIFETHQLEYGFRKVIQASIIKSKNVQTIVISNSLAQKIRVHHNFNLTNLIVLHDAAPTGIKPIAPVARRSVLAKVLRESVSTLSDWEAVCGYFGQLYQGRGIEILEEMARKRPSTLFLVFGGNNFEVSFRRARATANLRYFGHIDHPLCRSIQRAVDILLMPYQRRVSIGIRGHDTASWMSPMKMFEYLAAGVPIISSDLPVLREVLVNRRNALLVAPDDPGAWTSALDELTRNKELASFIGCNAHFDYSKEYTWSQRAIKLIRLSQRL